VRSKSPKPNSATPAGSGTSAAGTWTKKEPVPTSCPHPLKHQKPSKDENVSNIEAFLWLGSSQMRIVRSVRNGVPNGAALSQPPTKANPNCDE